MRGQAHGEPRLPTLEAHGGHEPGRDGALRRPRRVQRRNGSALYCAGGDIAARCPYQSMVHGEAGRKPGEEKAAQRHGRVSLANPIFHCAFKIQPGLLAKMRLLLAAVGMVSKPPKPTSVKYDSISVTE